MKRSYNINKKLYINKNYNKLSYPNRQKSNIP